MLHAQPGCYDGQLGALRRLGFGPYCFIEQMTVLDEVAHRVAWSITDDPRNTNPWAGSFLVGALPEPAGTRTVPGALKHVSPGSQRLQCHAACVLRC